jgi:hypothetical protein
MFCCKFYIMVVYPIVEGARYLAEAGSQALYLNGIEPAVVVDAIKTFGGIILTSSILLGLSAGIVSLIQYDGNKPMD